QISNEGLREHVRSKLAVPLAQENAAIQNQAFRGAANAHAAGRDRYLRYLVDHITLDPEDKLLTGGVDALHAAIDDAVTQRFATPEQALQEKRRSALALCAGHYARMSRVDPGLAIRELESPENGHPLLPHLPQQLRESLIQQAQDQQENDVKDAEHAALRRQQESQRASAQAENQIVANLMSETPTLTRTDISATRSSRKPRNLTCSPWPVGRPPRIPTRRLPIWPRVACSTACVCRMAILARSPRSLRSTMPTSEGSSARTTSTSSARNSSQAEHRP